MNAIEIKNLSKSFRTMYAVDHLDMTVPAGAIYGFIFDVFLKLFVWRIMQTSSSRAVPSA